MKERILGVFCFLSYWCGLDGLFYRLNRKAKRILTFHNVLSDDLFRDGIANGVSNRLSDFEKIVIECSKRYRFSTDLFDCSTLTITFDDGYRNQYSTAFRFLKSRDIPAYLFVAGDVASGEGLVIDRLLHWVSEAPVEFIPGGDRLAYWTGTVWPAFCNDVAAKGKNLFAELDAKYPYEKILAALPEEYRVDRLGGISHAEMDEMRAAGWRLGWHTKSHYPLAKLSVAELKEELTCPNECKNVCFSYPYGNPVEVGQESVRMVEELGYPNAVSNTNVEIQSISRYFLPRMSFLPGKSKYRLHFQLSGLEYFIKNRRLLPVVNLVEGR